MSKASYEFRCLVCNAASIFFAPPNLKRFPPCIGCGSTELRLTHYVQSVPKLVEVLRLEIDTLHRRIAELAPDDGPADDQRRTMH